MYLLKLTEMLRRIFADFAVPELPAFPAPLVEPWCHPDIYLSIAGRGIGSCFAFQIPVTAAGFLADQSCNNHDLVWFAGLQNGEYLKTVSDFLQILQKELFLKDENAVFSILADSRRKFLPFEEGSSWKIFLAGVECGRMTVYAGIPGVNTDNRMAPVLILNLRAIARISDSSDYLQEISWSPGVGVERLAVFNAWNPGLPTSECSLSEVKDEINKISNASDANPEAKLCHLLGIYGAYARVINQNQ
ncbi:MAG: hypothetical protein PHD82_00510, partial [Candidatus Riflebacteria bacterium]|nr:hypothetical protein [Candidatus Riflebacteria bacterium]